MTSTTRARTTSVTNWTWKDIAFPLISGALGLLLLLTTGTYLVVPWQHHADIHDPTVAVPLMHLWHYAQAGMHSTLLMAAPVLLSAWRPRQRVLLMQFVVVAVGVLAVMLLPWRPKDALTVTIMFGVLTALYPDLRSLVSRPRFHGASRPLLGLTLLCSPFLVYESVWLVRLQVLGHGGDHATAGHWIAAASIPLTIIVAGLFAASKRPSWRSLGSIAGVSLLYLGAAAFGLRGFDGSWGPTGGGAALVAGVAYLILTWRETAPH